MRWASLTHFVSTASCTCQFKIGFNKIKTCWKQVHQVCTFLTRRVFIMLSVRGCVVMSNKRKFCFSVVRTPFSTRFLARRSRTFFNWYLNFKGFQVSPGEKIDYRNRISIDWKKRLTNRWDIRSSFELFQEAQSLWRAWGLRRAKRPRWVNRFWEESFCQEVTFFSCHPFPVQHGLSDPIRWGCNPSVRSICNHSRMMCNPTWEEIQLNINK